MPSSFNIEGDCDSCNEDEFKIRYTNDEAIEKAGGFGKFQWLYVTLAIHCFMPVGFFTYNLSVFTMKPVFMCPNPEGGSYLCKEGERDIDPCRNGELIDGAYPDFSYDKSLYNWIHELDLYCSSSLQTSMFGALHFTGVLFGMASLAYTSIYGRRVNLIVTSWIVFFVATLTVLIHNLTFRYVGMFVLGILMVQKINAYVLATEHSPFRYQMTVAMVLLSYDSLTYIFTSMYFSFVSKNWAYLSYFYIIACFLIACGATMIPESARFLADKGEHIRARSVVNQMALMNGSNLQYESWSFQHKALTQEPSDDSKAQAEISPVRMMMEEPILGINLAITVFSWIACSFNYYLLSFYVKFLGGNVFLNNAMIAVAGIFGKFLSLSASKWVTSKTNIVWCFIISITFGFGLIFATSGFLITICLSFSVMGFAAGFTLCYFISSEYFPPLFVGFAFSVSQFISRSTTIMSYLMSGLKHPYPIVLLCITTGVALLTLVFLKHPKHK